SDRFTDVRQLAVALAPFAPQGSIGRAYADSLGATESGSLRPYVPPSPSSGGVDQAPPAMNLARPPSESGRPGASRGPEASARRLRGDAAVAAGGGRSRGGSRGRSAAAHTEAGRWASGSAGEGLSSLSSRSARTERPRGPRRSRARPRPRPRSLPRRRSILRA